jgi:hypothetical protein
MNTGLNTMGEAIPPDKATWPSDGNHRGGADAIPVKNSFIHVELKEDLRLGEKHLFAKQSPQEILEDTIKKAEWFKGIILSTAFFEHFGSISLRNHFRGRISDDRIRNLTLAEIIVFLFGLGFLSQKGYSKMMRVKEKRDDLAHYPFTEIDPKEAERLIIDALECLEELKVA